MHNESSHHGESGDTIYAKPLPDGHPPYLRIGDVWLYPPRDKEAALVFAHEVLCAVKEWGELVLEHFVEADEVDATERVKVWVDTTSGWAKINYSLTNDAS